LSSQRAAKRIRPLKEDVVIFTSGEMQVTELYYNYCHANLSGDPIPSTPCGELLGSVSRSSQNGPCRDHFPSVLVPNFHLATVLLWGAQLFAHPYQQINSFHGFPFRAWILFTRVSN
jgi:hypothetical protein